MPDSKFSLEITVKEEHTDELNHVNNVVYLQWVQDIAKKHWETLATKDITNDFVWVVVRHEIDYKLPCLVGETLLLKTCVADDLSGATWGRHVWVMKGDKIAVQAYSKWCLLDRNSGKPVRIGGEIKNVFLGDG